MIPAWPVTNIEPQNPWPIGIVNPSTSPWFSALRTTSWSLSASGIRIATASSSSAFWASWRIVSSISSGSSMALIEQAARWIIVNFRLRSARFWMLSAFLSAVATCEPKMRNSSRSALVNA